MDYQEFLLATRIVQIFLTLINFYLYKKLLKDFIENKTYRLLYQLNYLNKGIAIPNRFTYQE